MGKLFLGPLRNFNFSYDCYKIRKYKISVWTLISLPICITWCLLCTLHAHEYASMHLGPCTWSLWRRMSQVLFYFLPHCYLKTGSLIELEGSDFSYAGRKSSSYACLSLMLTSGVIGKYSLCRVNHEGWRFQFGTSCLLRKWSDSLSCFPKILTNIIICFHILALWYFQKHRDNWYRLYKLN